VVVENVATKQQEFLSGHTNTVSCVSLSHSGQFIASGQITDMGFKVVGLTVAYKIVCTIPLSSTKPMN